MADKETFETALRDLEEAVESLESGDLPLEESLVRFEAGVKSAAVCRKALRAVENRVELLLKDKEGLLTLENFDQE
ncbi:MAG: exodeoxyribonuclease VII small subunit [Desulfuromonas sp.]|uniref:exodeoxyribonuclease VII small subunit n=1 Tax=Desulfuromonas sp. TaxID=892 RepID=UPI000CB51F43|nr:exodeoxyribonuclease VII small subunit [Desulfuromonas sp.]PLX83113.1 MAG: exodeoxyribonuclease VII small subunit [Desulfuromonas sp.]